MNHGKHSQPDYVQLTTSVVVAYISNHQVQKSELPALISTVHDALLGKHSPQAEITDKLKPPISIKQSITPDFLICLEDGKPYRTLKRHLGKLGMTPEQYREKWSLPSNYPMVARNYSKHRSALAKNMGLGRYVPPEGSDAT